MSSLMIVFIFCILCFALFFAVLHFAGKVDASECIVFAMVQMCGVLFFAVLCGSLL